MKQIYTLSLAVLISIGATVRSQNETVRSLSLYNLTSEKLNTSHIDSQKNQITFSTYTPSNTLSGEEWKTAIYSEWSTAKPLDCIGESVAETAPYNVVTLRGRSVFSVAQSPYILIALPEKHDIQEVEVLGFATSPSSPSAKAQLICAFSSSGTNDKDFKVDANSWTPELEFEQATCSGQMKQSLLSGTKYIKLIANKSFANVSIGFNAYPMILAINLYAKDTGTSIGSETEDALTINLYGRNLQISEPADVVIYDIAGKTVAQYVNMDNAYLNFLNDGIYVVSATNQKGQKTTQKILLR